VKLEKSFASAFAEGDSEFRRRRTSKFPSGKPAGFASKARVHIRVQASPSVRKLQPIKMIRRIIRIGV